MKTGNWSDYLATLIKVRKIQVSKLGANLSEGKTDNLISFRKVPKRLFNIGSRIFVHRKDYALSLLPCIAT